MSIRRIEYSEFEDAVSVLEQQIKASNWTPEIVLGVARGGLMPAVCLSHRFNVPVASVFQSFRDRKSLETVEARTLHALVEGRRALVVDDIYDSGETFLTLRENFQGRQFDIRWLVLHYNEAGNPSMVPNYFYEKINKEDDPSWLVYPWETA